MPVNTDDRETPLRHIMTHFGKSGGKSRPDRETTINRADMVKLFSRMQARYLHRWTSAFPTRQLVDLAIAEWMSVLNGLSVADFDRGLAQWGGEWPPSAMEFKTACRRPRCIAAHRPYHPLLTPPRNPECARAAIDGMRAMLGAAR